MIPSQAAQHRRIPAPAASRRAHLLAAALLWTAAGLGLMTAGTVWMLAAPPAVAAAAWALAIVAGALKARFVLDRMARRIADRIEERGDGRCLGGFLSWKSWALVVLMMLLGRGLRASPLPVPVRGAIYAAIGTALLVASRRVWARWRARSHGAP